MRCSRNLAQINDNNLHIDPNREGLRGEGEPEGDGRRDVGDGVHCDPGLPPLRPRLLPQRERLRQTRRRQNHLTHPRAG